MDFRISCFVCAAVAMASMPMTGVFVLKDTVVALVVVDGSGGRWRRRRKLRQRRMTKSFIYLFVWMRLRDWGVVIHRVHILLSVSQTRCMRVRVRVKNSLFGLQKWIFWKHFSLSLCIPLPSSLLPLPSPPSLPSSPAFPSLFLPLSLAVVLSPCSPLLSSLFPCLPASLPLCHSPGKYFIYVCVVSASCHTFSLSFRFVSGSAPHTHTQTAYGWEIHQPNSKVKLKLVP